MSKAVANIASLSPLHNLPPARLADQLGAIKAEIAALELREKTLREELLRRGITEAEGALFSATITQAVRWTLDTKAVKAEMGAPWWECALPANSRHHRRGQAARRRRETRRVRSGAPKSHLGPRAAALPPARSFAHQEKAMANDPLSHVASWLTPSAGDGDPSEIERSAPHIDPVVTLGREWGAAENAVGLADISDDQLGVTQHTNRVLEIEKEMAKLVPSSLEGVLWQLRKLKHLTDFDLARSPHEADCFFPMLDNTVAGVERLLSSDGSGAATVTSVSDDSHAAPDSDAEFEAACVVADKIEDTITATPSSGAAGLAIKSYLALRYGERPPRGMRQPLARKPLIIRSIPASSRIRSASCPSLRRWQLRLSPTSTVRAMMNPTSSASASRRRSHERRRRRLSRRAHHW